jgi:hypothetical protein
MNPLTRLSFACSWDRYHPRHAGRAILLVVDIGGVVKTWTARFLGLWGVKQPDVVVCTAAGAGGEVSSANTAVKRAIGCLASEANRARYGIESPGRGRASGPARGSERRQPSRRRSSASSSVGPVHGPMTRRSGLWRDGRAVARRIASTGAFHEPYRRVRATSLSRERRDRCANSSARTRAGGPSGFFRIASPSWKP